MPPVLTVALILVALLVAGAIVAFLVRRRRAPRATGVAPAAAMKGPDIAYRLGIGERPEGYVGAEEVLAAREAEAAASAAEAAAAEETGFAAITVSSPLDAEPPGASRTGLLRDSVIVVAATCLVLFAVVAGVPWVVDGRAPASSAAGSALPPVATPAPSATPEPSASIPPGPSPVPSPTAPTARGSSTSRPASPEPAASLAPTFTPAAPPTQPPSVRRYQDGSKALSYAPAWSVRRNARASGGTMRYASSAAARVRLRVSDAVAASVVGPVGPGFGSIRVYVDGRLVATVSEAADDTVFQQVLAVVPLDPGSAHTLELRPAGNGRVYLDAILVTDDGG